MGRKISTYSLFSTPLFRLARASAVEGVLRHIGVGSTKRLFGWLVGAIKEVWVHIISLQGGGKGGERGRGEEDEGTDADVAL